MKVRRLFYLAVVFLVNFKKTTLAGVYWGFWDYWFRSFI